MLEDIQSLLETNEDWHGPVRAGNCVGCHSPHGGEEYRLLKRPYPATFYSPFDIANYSLCFSCHEEALVLEPETSTLTFFRDGTRNLHFLHVNREDRGRTCRACHEVHASPHPSHIRDTVPFGNYDLPLNFQKHESGGSCFPACHVKQSYQYGSPEHGEARSHQPEKEPGS